LKRSKPVIRGWQEKLSRLKWRTINLQPHDRVPRHVLVRGWNVTATLGTVRGGMRQWAASAPLNDPRAVATPRQIGHLEECFRALGCPADVTAHLSKTPGPAGQTIYHCQWYESVVDGTVHWADGVPAVAEAGTQPAGLCTTPGCAEHEHTPEENDAWERQCMEEFGFFSHYVPDAAERFVNLHTHGFDESWGHPDFGIVLPITMELGTVILQRLAELVKGGEQFVDGGTYDHVLQGLRVRMVSVPETGRKILRVLIPDKAGVLPGEEGCAAVFNEQLTVDTDTPPPGPAS
jgi:hypothetical protein